MPSAGKQTCRRGEPAVDRLWIEAERNEAEFERRHVPADSADAELALTEKRPSERAERRPRGLPYAPAGRQPEALLKAHEPCTGEGAVDPVDGGRIVAVCAQRNLESGHTGVRRGRSRPCERECCAE
jgi:hypothetical protein